MKYRQLQAFRAVIITGTVTQAAESLGISQPAISNLIVTLEHQLGFSLFERRKGRLYPTPDAKYLYEDVERALSGFDKVTQTAKDIRELKTGTLSIACMPGLSLGFLPKVVAEFLDDRPKVTVSLQTRSSQKVQEWIAAQLFDVGLAELPIDHTGIESELLSFDCVCVLPENHSLAVKAIITPKDLDGLPFISLARDHMTFFRIKNAFSKAGAKRNIRVETQLFAPACSLVARGAGVSIIDPITAADYHNRGVVIRPFRPCIPFEIGILWPALQPRSALVEAFITLLKASAKTYEVI